MKNHLKTFLGGSDRSSSREYVLTTRLIHDLSVAAAACGYDLLVYLPTVDADGFDIIFDDKDRLVAVQLKSVVDGGKASSWRIRRSLLRPTPAEAGLYGFEMSPSGTGRGGGVILITVRDAGEQVTIDYAYTDMAVLSALWLNIIPKPTAQLERLLRLRTELQAERGGSIELPRSAFVRAPTPSKLLALAGLHSLVKSSWRLHLRDLLQHEHLGTVLDAPATSLQTLIAKELELLGSDAG